MDIQRGQILDRVGVVCSGACVVHCIGLSLLPLLSPTLVGHIENRWVHLVFFIVVFPVAALAFFKRKKKSGLLLPFRLGIIGLVLLALALFLECFFPHRGVKVFLNVIGGLFLVSGHLANMMRAKN